LAEVVRTRAKGICEYCRLPQDSQEATFQIDHVKPFVLKGKSVAENLALSCVTCSLKKAARESSRDPKTGKVVRLFNPRIDKWAENFGWTATLNIRGKTSIGRATVHALGMNRGAIVLIRRELAKMGRLPLS
jgi:hypothetical protein